MFHMDPFPFLAETSQESSKMAQHVTTLTTRDNNDVMLENKIKNSTVFIHLWNVWIYLNNCETQFAEQDLLGSFCGLQIGERRV
jgi:hypothetical protein